MELLQQTLWGGTMVLVILLLRTLGKRFFAQDGIPGFVDCGGAAASFAAVACPAGADAGPRDAAAGCGRGCHRPSLDLGEYAAVFRRGADGHSSTCCGGDTVDRFYGWLALFCSRPILRYPMSVACGLSRLLCRSIRRKWRRGWRSIGWRGAFASAVPIRSPRL